MYGCHSWGHMPEMVFVFGVFMLLLVDWQRAATKLHQYSGQSPQLQLSIAASRYTNSNTGKLQQTGGAQTSTDGSGGFENYVHRPKDSLVLSH